MYINFYKKFNKNLSGVDYVVGDIHGEYGALEDALAAILFNPEQDRLFSVGDLVDRGTVSSKALDWVAKPWFFPCRGNHDDFVIRAVYDTNFDLWVWVMLNGGEWWLSMKPAFKEDIASAFLLLPLVMEIETEIGSVGIVHADVPPNMNWSVFIKKIKAGNGEALEYSMWSRARAHGELQKNVAGIARVFCGHTVMQNGLFQRSGNVFFLDTGAGYGLPHSKLTVVPLTIDETTVALLKK